MFFKKCHRIFVDRVIEQIDKLTQIKVKASDYSIGPVSIFGYAK